MKEIPFSLAYDINTMIPVKIGEPSLRRLMFTWNSTTKA